MNLRKTLIRLHRIDDLIARRATGNPEEFAQKLGVSKRRLFELLNEIKGYGVEIEYNPMRESYIYSEGGPLFEGDSLNMNRIVGGKADSDFHKYFHVFGRLPWFSAEKSRSNAFSLRCNFDFLARANL
ncbi:hypothetical protein KFE98_11230 [bacterium SCSIO 12741]|nr:hypothetical protein KFE98_11230 [bacterium SCSIO 12741]